MASEKMYGRDLVDAIMTRDSSAVKALMKKKANTDFVIKGDKAIHLAARSGLYRIIKYLLEYGEDVNKPNQFGNTALHIAARDGQMKIISLLMDNGAEPNSQNKDGETPLHNCVGYQSMDIIETYVRMGMDVNAQTKNGDTPLHLAVKYSREESIEALLLCNADASIKNTNGKRADQIAKHASIGEQIRTHGLLAAAMSSGYIQSHGTKLSHLDVKSPLYISRVGILIESMDIPTDFPTAFYCRREKSENTTLNLNNADDEHIISDVYMFRVRDVYRDINVTLTVSLYAFPAERETLLVRFLAGESGTIVSDVFVKKDEPHCTLSFPMIPECTSAFVFCVSPKTETIGIGEEETVIESDVNAGFSMQIPEGAFKENTTLSLKVFEPISSGENDSNEDDEITLERTDAQQVTEESQEINNENTIQHQEKENEQNTIGANGLIPTPIAHEITSNDTPEKKKRKKKKKKHKRKQDEIKHDDSKLLSDIFEINLSGEQPTKGLMMQIPVKDRSKLENGGFQIIRVDDDNEQVITKLDVEATITEDGNIMFETSHFSMYVIVPKTIASQNQSTSDLSTIYEHVQNARQRKQYARFFMMLQHLDKEDCCGRHVLLVECIRAGSSKRRRSRWKKKGFEKQKPKNSGKLLLAPGQEFIIRLQGDAIFDKSAGETGTRKLVFSPHRASFQPYQIRLPPIYKHGRASVSLYPINRDATTNKLRPEQHEGFTEEDFENMDPVATLKMQLHLPPEEDPFPGELETLASYKTLTEIYEAEQKAKKKRIAKKEASLKQLQQEIQDQGLPSRPQTSHEASRFKRPTDIKIDI